MDEDEGEERLNPLAVCVAVALVLSSLFAALLSLLLLTQGQIVSLIILWIGPVVGWLAAPRGRFIVALLGAASPFALVAFSFWALSQLVRY